MRALANVEPAVIAATVAVSRACNRAVKRPRLRRDFLWRMVPICRTRNHLVGQDALQRIVRASASRAPPNVRPDLVCATRVERQVVADHELLHPVL